MGAVGITTRSQFALLGFAITVMSALALPTNVGRAHGPRSDAATPLENTLVTFKWSIEKRFGAKRPDGIVDYHWNAGTYDKKYVNPDGWKVDFDACGLGETPASTFAVQIDGVAVAPNPSSCKFSHEFDRQGVYTVTITRTSPAAVLEDSVTVKDLLIVSLGDSFASGQGNPDIPRSDSSGARWVDNLCARSSKAGPAQAAMQLEDKDPHTSVTFISFACTGARIKEGILEDQHMAGVKLAPQIERLEKTLKGRPIDALIISAGGNDIGFSDLVARCIFDRKCHEDWETLYKYCSGLSLLDARYKLLSEKIVKNLSVKKVFITEYPDLVRDQNGDFCRGSVTRGISQGFSGLLEGINGDEAKWASENVIKELNLKVKDAAERYGWVYVTGIARKFTKHGYCAGNDRWVRTFSDARQLQGADGSCNVVTLASSFRAIKDCVISSGAVHPAEEGHKAYASVLVDSVGTELRAAGSLPTHSP